MHSVASSRTELAVDGMTCGGCARNVAGALQGVAGVANATVQLEKSQASVRWNPGATANVESLVRAVNDAGYHARPIPAQDSGHADHAGHDGHTHARTWGVNVLSGIIPTALLMIGEWIFHWQNSPALRWLSFALATVVVFGPGLQFFRGAWRQLRAGTSNMDTLVALGSATAYGFSLWELLSGQSGHLYFMEAAAIITLISVGHWLEAQAGARASNSLRALMNLAPPLALRREADGTERSVDVSELIPGDTMVLRPGDRVATDGEIIDGASSLDESMLTGESLPVEKSPGSPIFAGTWNQTGRLLARVTSVGEETALAHIISAVQRAQSSRARIQRIGDRVAGVFVPIVILIALAAGLWWGLAPENARRLQQALAPAWWHLHPPADVLAAAVFIVASVLIVACPCAMGLATPAAIMAGSNAAARLGILVRDGVALEKAGDVSAILFDKTGTLTEGNPAVVATEFFAPDSNPPSTAPNPQVARLAAALARPSAHPLSAAIAKLDPAAIGFEDWTEVRGAGIQARLKNPDGTKSLLRLGSLRWLRESGTIVVVADKFAGLWLEQAATVLGLARDNQLLAAFALRDRLKPGAAEVIAQLRRQGLRSLLVTGDNPVTARTIAAQAGIPGENVYAEVRPEEKAALVERLQKAGERIAFVGDGINDAPALKTANLGIAVSRASDVAREAADIILLRTDIEAVPQALGLARATLRTIRQNLFWAFFYNTAAIPLAALGFMSPVLCAATMGLSDVVVIGNSLRLFRWRQPVQKKDLPTISVGPRHVANSEIRGPKSE